MQTLAPDSSAEKRAEAGRERRADRYRRRSILAHVSQRVARASSWASIPWRRCASCGVTNTDDIVSTKVRHGDDGPTAYFVGLSTCASVWMCAVCSAKIRSRRSVEVSALAIAHSNAGGSNGMMTLTIRHYLGMHLGDMLDAMADAWRSLQQSSDWRDLREFGLVGQVRSIEITHGFFKPEGQNNGWHPHYHVLLLWDDDEDHSADVAWIQQAWSSRIEARLGIAPDAHGFDYRKLDAYGTKYVTKIANEMTRADLKGSASIWQLLDALEDGESWVYGRVAEYFAATKGRRAIQWSRGLAERYGIRVKKTDEEAVNDIVDGETVDEMAPNTVRRMMKYRRGKAPAVIEYLERIEARHRPGPAATGEASTLALAASADGGST